MKIGPAGAARPALSLATAAGRVQSLVATGRHGDAVPWLRLLLVVMPNKAELLRLLGNIALALGRVEEAGRSLNRGLRVAPADPGLLRSGPSLPLGAAWPEQALKRQLVIDPTDHRAHAMRAHRQGVFGGPTEWSRTTPSRIAVVLAPSEASYLAVTAARAQRFGEGETAMRLSGRAILSKPDLSAGYLVLSDAHRLTEITSGAEWPAERAALLAPDDPVALTQVAMVRNRLARFDESEAAIDRAVALRPRDAGIAARAASLIRYMVESREQIAGLRRRISDLIERDDLDPIAHPIRDVGTVPFFLAYHGVDDRDLMVRLCDFYRRMAPSLNYTAPHMRHRGPGSSPAGRRKRVGFLSSFFRRHSVYHTTEGFLRSLDRRELEVFVIQMGEIPAEIRGKLDPWADRIVTVRPNDLASIQAALASFELDVLVFADIGLTATSYFVSFGRYAPQQIVLPGHPATTGVDTVDVFFTSDWTEPPDYRAHYSEIPHRADGLAVRYSREFVPRAAVSRSDFGLPERGGLYICGQMAFKIHPEFDRVLGDILERDPTGTLLLFEASGDFGSANQQLLERIRRANADRLDVLKRLRMFPRLSLDRFIGLMGVADVMLDTTHFNGGNTTMQTLSIGRPLVTLPKALMRGRVGLSTLRQIGMVEELAASSEADYVDRAVRIATDRDYAADLGARLAERGETMLETPEGGRSLNELLVTGEPTG